MCYVPWSLQSVESLNVNLFATCVIINALGTFLITHPGVTLSVINFVHIIYYKLPECSDLEIAIL